MIVKDYEFEETCFAWPEAYDIFFDGDRVAHARLRHGSFTVTSDNGDVLLSEDVSSHSDGIFATAEHRVTYLRKAADALDGKALTDEEAQIKLAESNMWIDDF